MVIESNHTLVVITLCSVYRCQIIMLQSCIFPQGGKKKSEQFFSVSGMPNYKTVSLTIIMYLKYYKKCHPNYALSRNICS